MERIILIETSTALCSAALAEDGVIQRRVTAAAEQFPRGAKQGVDGNIKKR